MAIRTTRRTRGHNAFKQCFEMSLANTKNAVHARLTTQRKILATMRAMWLSMQPYPDNTRNERVDTPPGIMNAFGYWCRRVSKLNS